MLDPIEQGKFLDIMDSIKWSLYLIMIVLFLIAGTLVGIGLKVGS